MPHDTVFTVEQLAAIDHAGELLAVGYRAMQQGNRSAAETGRQATRTTLIDAGLEPDDPKVTDLMCDAAVRCRAQWGERDTVCHLPGPMPCVRACYDVCPRWQARKPVPGCLDS